MGAASLAPHNECRLAIAVDNELRSAYNTHGIRKRYAAL